MVDYLGWAATAVFAGSYFCKRPNTLRRMQILGAVMWMAYGAVMRAAPVFVANLLVACAAAWTATNASRASTVRVSSKADAAR